MLPSKIITSLVMTLLIFNVIAVNAQQPRLATFHETAQIIVDQKFQNQTSTSITVLTTSIQEMRIPQDLDQKIRDMKNVTAVVITNEDQCVLGVKDEACILINVPKDAFPDGIKEAQSKGRKVGDALIDDINKAFSLDAEFNSVFIHVDDKLNRKLQTSGIISGRGTVSAVYTMPKYDTSYLYESLAAILLPLQIREAGGFLDIAEKIAEDPNSSVTFSITPKDNMSIYQLQVSRDYPIKEKVTSINPLVLLGTEKLERSNYFSAGFFPLNSLVQVTVLSNETMKVISHGSELVPTIEKDGETYPSDLTKNGWFFDSDSGETIVGKYLFGKSFEVSKDDLVITLGKSDVPQTDEKKIRPEIRDNSSVYVLIGIGAAAAGAISLYLKKSKTKA